MNSKLTIILSNDTSCHSIVLFRVLPSMVKQPEESVLDFSKRVQQTMAKTMGLVSTVYTSSDKFELIKQLKHSTASTGKIIIYYDNYRM